MTNGSNHEITNYQNVAYSYINDGKLATVTSGANTYLLKYDALGRTVSRSLNGQTTYYYYQGEKPIMEQGATNATNDYGIGIDEPVIRFLATDVYYFYQDHEGSVTHVRSSVAGNTIESYRYDAFGQPTIKNASGTTLTTSAINNRFMFTGREWAPVNFGFYEYRARAYHPGLGRFMSEDPKGFDAGDYNLFRYCGNDPVDKTDPMGLQTETINPDTNNPEPHTAQGIPSNNNGGFENSGVYKGLQVINRDAITTAAHNVELKVTTQIKDSPKSELGVKTVQTVSLNDTGQFRETSAVGSTRDFISGKWVQGDFAHSATVVSTRWGYNVRMMGRATSGPIMNYSTAVHPGLGAIAQVALTIHYNLNFFVNFSTHSVSMVGTHSSYPSFSAAVNGRSFYAFREGFPLVGLVPFREAYAATGAEF